ncbi:MAG: hypothetical protein CMC74_05965 [Flavobacteriaceae bacterium]|nr:hypothetical protein [Flavobacteriaceae bacterium]|tara:strand:- start:10210 stop:12651 length:2442 start_codon:yes stop_codon:yes gene_type:complete
MKSNYFAFFIVTVCCFGFVNAQVGINTTSPSAGSILDVESSDKGVLIPRVNIANLATIAPITGGSTESLLVYNTNTTTGPGFFYWDGTVWVAIDGGRDWKLEGNNGTTPGTGAGQHFVGTNDAQDLVVATNSNERFRVTSDGRILATQLGSAATPLFAWAGDTDKGFYSSGADELGFVTNGTERFRIPNANQVHAMANGANGNPFYSWNNDTDLGIWRSTADRLNISAGGREMVEFNESGANSEVVFNDGGTDTDFRVETSGQANMIYVDGSNNIVGVGTNTPNGLLDLSSSTMGMIPPRVALTSTLTEAPVVNPQGGSLLAGTCVYNTATAGTAPNNVAPGLYFWNGARWVAFAGSPGGLDWTLTGNTGTNTTSNYLGTADNVGVVFRTNGTERMEIEDDGQVNIGLGATASTAGYQLEVQATATDGNAIVGHGNGLGYGVRAENLSANGGAGRAFLAHNDNYVINSIMYNANTSNSVGLLASGNGASLSYYATTGGTFNGTNFGGAGIANETTGTGIIGTGNGRTSIVYDPDGSGVGGSGDVLGVYGYAGNGGVSSSNYGNAGARFQLDADNDITTTTGNGATRASAILAGFNNVRPPGTSSSRDSYYGGYFSGGSEGSGTPSYAYVGMRYRTNSNGDGVSFGGQDYKIIGTGSVSTLINDQNNTPRVMFAPEAPEILFQDFGVGQLVNGQARINLDPILKRNIYVDKNNPLKVYVTLEGECNGIYVTNKSADGFTVKELQGGTSNASFSWQIVATRADRINADGTIASKHVGIRLPEGPGPIKSKAMKEEKSKEVKLDDIRPSVSANVKN